MHTHADLLTRTANIFQFMEGKMMNFSILLSYEVYIAILCFQKLMETLFRKLMDQTLFKIGAATTSKLVCSSTNNT